MNENNLEDISPDITEQIEWIKAYLGAVHKIGAAEMEVIRTDLYRQEYNKLCDTHDAS